MVGWLLLVVVEVVIRCGDVLFFYYGRWVDGLGVLVFLMGKFVE